MEKGFTLVEVIILLVIFIMVAILVIPLSIDDTIHARNIVKWKHANNNFKSFSNSIKLLPNTSKEENFVLVLKKQYPFNKTLSYKIKYMNEETPSDIHNFKKIYATNNRASIAYNWYSQPYKDFKNNKTIYGILMFDVNGKRGPNVWGKDIFGYNIYDDEILPLGSNMSKEDIEFDCSSQGTGMYCSCYYLKGGMF